MRNFHRICLTSLFAALPMLALSCGSDEDDKPPSSGGGSGGKGGSGGSTGGSSGTSTGGTGATTGGAGGTTGGTGGSATGGTGGTGTGGTGTGGTGTGGTGGSATACDLNKPGATHQAIPNPTGTMTLTADKIWDLSDTTYVENGTTLTIEPCTRIEGKKTPLGTLVVSRGGKIMAAGTATSPILFTSAAAAGSRLSGDWGGVILLGRAPNFQGDTVNIEGLAADAKNQHGGTDAADNSGTMTYVGILFPGYELSPGNEINGLTLGSVGTGTTLENIFVAQSADDCFEWFGGTVNASKLIAQNCDDDVFDTDWGYSGTIDTALGRYTRAPTETSNGLETGYDDAVAITPTSNTNATQKNITACGFGAAVAKVGHGILVRDFVTGTVDEFVATGYDYGFNQEKPLVGSGVVFSNSVFFGMFANAGSQIVNPADNNTTDGNFDEAAWFTGGTNNSTTALAFTVADCNAAGGPAAAVKNSARGAFKGSATWTDWVPADWWADN
jgi:hypothetical protein